MRKQYVLFCKKILFKTSYFANFCNLNRLNLQVPKNLNCTKQEAWTLIQHDKPSPIDGFGVLGADGGLCLAEGFALGHFGFACR